MNEESNPHIIKRFIFFCLILNEVNNSNAIIMLALDYVKPEKQSFF